MCDHSPKTRKGARLQDGAAHSEDHSRWSRRQFLSSLGLASAGTALMLGSSRTRLLAQTTPLGPLNATDTDRILVLVQLDGGNDGLNTIIPFTNDQYYRQRPNLGIRRNQTLEITDELGLHTALAPLLDTYNDGQMAIVQNVGYAMPDQSHFRSMDIWMSASDADQYDSSGWSGRYLETVHPDFVQNPPAQPLGVQLGGTSLMFQGRENNMGMTVDNPEVFERLAERGTVYRVDDLPQTTYGSEMHFVRTVANNSFRYAGALQTAARAGSNRETYDTNLTLSQNLSIVARLIRGNLGAKVYMVSIGGFDTHAEQPELHAQLLSELATSLRDFMADLKSDGLMDRVMVMTFSEFGRTIWENGSSGTDHATAAPMFLFGPSVAGGLYGSAPDLTNVNDIGDMVHQYDFRQVYQAVLSDWLGVPADSILPRTLERLPLVNTVPTANESPHIPEAFSLGQNYPNPFNPNTQIPFALTQAGQVDLKVYDVSGRAVRTLVSGVQPAGRHQVNFDAAKLPSGTYVYRLKTPSGVQTRKMTLVR